jgi:DNA invertase Pin-like site-specific DNA recombinase
MGKRDTIRAVGYTRVSTDEQPKQGLSLDAQGDETREYSQRPGPGPKGPGRR